MFAGKVVHAIIKYSGLQDMIQTQQKAKIHLSQCVKLITKENHKRSNLYKPIWTID